MCSRRVLFNLRKPCEFVDTLLILVVGLPLGAWRAAYQFLVTRACWVFVPVCQKRHSPISMRSDVHLNNATIVENWENGTDYTGSLFFWEQWKQKAKYEYWVTDHIAAHFVPISKFVAHRFHSSNIRSWKSLERDLCVRHHADRVLNLL